MTDSLVPTKDGSGATQNVLVQLNAPLSGTPNVTPYRAEDEVQRAALLAALAPLTKLGASGPGSTGVDFSANTPAPPVLGVIGGAYGGSGPYAAFVLVAVKAANPSRASLEVQNLSGAPIVIVLDDGTAAAGAALVNASVQAIGGGVGVGAQGGSYGPNPYEKGRIQVFAPTSGAQVYCREN